MDAAPASVAPPARAFRPSQPLPVKQTPSPTPSTSAPPCFAAIRLPPPSASQQPVELLYSPEPLPTSAWDADGAASSKATCLAALLLAETHNLSVSFTKI